MLNWRRIMETKILVTIDGKQSPVKQFSNVLKPMAFLSPPFAITPKQPMWGLAGCVWWKWKKPEAS
jgi:hypothetical protein